jgi:CrcB protein
VSEQESVDPDRPPPDHDADPAAPPLSRCLAAVAAGGVVGALARYGLTLVFPVLPGRFPWTIFGINVLGCALIGVLMATLARHPGANPLIRLFLGTGALGGFTTFSTYALDTGELAGAGHPGTALGYLFGTLVVALLAVLGGEYLGTRLPIRDGR